MTGPPAAADQPISAPFRLNSQRPAAYGAAAASPVSVPTEADRTAASMAVVRVTLARSGRQSSDQIGPLRRYLAGTGSDPAYQPTPKPSTFIVPCFCQRGAQACSTRLCGGSNSSDLIVTSSPR